jgi:hypothetical protein
MNVCQICPREEDLKACESCGRFTCKSCLEDMKKQGYPHEECSYCGYRWYSAPKKEGEYKEVMPNVIADVVESIDTELAPIHANPAIGIAEEDIQAGEPIIEGESGVGLYRDVSLRTSIESDVFRDVPIRVQSLSEIRTDPQEPGGWAAPRRAHVSDVNSLNHEYVEAIIRVVNNDGGPMDLTGAVVTWGDIHGTISEPTMGEIKFIITREMQTNVDRNEPIDILIAGVHYRIGMREQWDSMLIRLPEPTSEAWAMPTETITTTLPYDSDTDFKYQAVRLIVLLGAFLAFILFLTLMGSL